MNLSETVFLLPAEDGDARMPIFTPAAELAFAGHPVLGTAFVAAEARQLTSVQLETAAAAVPLKLTRCRHHGAARTRSVRSPSPGCASRSRPARRSPGPHSCLPPSGSRHLACRSSRTPTGRRTCTSFTALKPHITALAGFAGASVYCFAGNRERQAGPGRGQRVCRRAAMPGSGQHARRQDGGIPQGSQQREHDRGEPAVQPAAGQSESR